MTELRKIIFESERTIVRQLLKSDFDDLLELYSKEESFKYDFEHPLAHYELGDYLNQIVQSYHYEESGYHMYGIELKSEEKIIGTFIYTLMDPKGLVCDIGGSLNSDYWKKGLAQEVGQESLKYLFSKNVEKVACGSFYQNKDSIKLIESLGFKKEGHVKMAIWLKDQYFDEVLYGYFRSDYQDE